MVPEINNPPFIHNKQQISNIMMLVCLATFPGIITQLLFFGWGTLFQICLGCISAISAEALTLKLRTMSVNSILSDNSAALTGLLLGISIPPFAPWWIIVLGSLFAIIIAKQIYGGLGNNPFNPAMIGYVMLLISFPVQMTNWLLPCHITAIELGFTDILKIIFIEHAIIDSDIDLISSSMKNINGISQATPLGVFKTLLNTGYNIEQIKYHSKYELELVKTINIWQWINLSYLLGGVFLLYKKIICWYIPLSFLITLAVCTWLNCIFSLQDIKLLQIHMLSGATMLGAFFILTDPVTTSITNFGRIIFGTMAGILVWLIRNFGGYPDGMAFAVLLANTAVPLIDHYTSYKTNNY